jgi:hypothetical protein
LEILACVEVVCLFDAVADGGSNRRGFLQSLQKPKALRRARLSSEGRVRVSNSIVEPPSSAVISDHTDFSQCSLARDQAIHDDLVGTSIPNLLWLDPLSEMVGIA